MTDLEARIADVEDRLEAIESRLDDLDGAVQAVRGYAGAVRAVNQSVERRADLALAKAERREAADADDAEQFVATDGVDWATLPREETVCTYGILRDGPLVISDLDEDDRISREAIESDHDLSFYAGAPLRTADGHCLGMVCVLDDRDRSFTSDDERALTWFAEQVMANVKRRGTN